MKAWSTRFILAIALTAPCLSDAAEQKRALTPEDLVDIRVVDDANIFPDGKRIAFVVTEPGDPAKPALPRDENIWTVPSDGSEPARRFVASPKSEDSPRWSPDGRWLAFLSDRGEDGQKQIWLLRLDGGEAEQLTSAGGGVDSFKWSPDSRMIAFLAHDAKTEQERKKKDQLDDAVEVDHIGKYSRLWVIGLADRRLVLVLKQDKDVQDFDWAPDGASFAVAAAPGLAALGASIRLEVIRRSDGAVLRKLADDVSRDSPNVRWSPDGTTILFAFEDTMAGVDSLIEQKIADPNRLGIGGWSRGGEMTAWATTHTNRFKAAVALAALIDFRMEWGGRPGPAGIVEAAFGDTPVHNGALFDTNSALTFVQNCRTPTLVFQGENDPVVPIAQAYEFYHSLKALGVETEMVVYPREGHDLGERAHQIDLQRRMLAWFDRHLKPPKEAK